jgi:hypothetical protein
MSTTKLGLCELLAENWGFVSSVPEDLGFVIQCQKAKAFGFMSL